MGKITNINESIGVLIQGVQLAQSKGVYTLEDAALLAEAIEFLSVKKEPTEIEDGTTEIENSDLISDIPTHKPKHIKDINI